MLINNAGLPAHQSTGLLSCYNLLPHFDLAQCPAKGFSLRPEMPLQEPNELSFGLMVYNVMSDIGNIHVYLFYDPGLT